MIAYNSSSDFLMWTWQKKASCSPCQPLDNWGGQLEVPFCPAGPSDIHIQWLIDGYSVDTPVMEYRRPVGQKEVLVSSWLRGGPLNKEARYHCVAEASTGSDTAEIDLHLATGGILALVCVDVGKNVLAEKLQQIGCVWRIFPGGCGYCQWFWRLMMFKSLKDVVVLGRWKHSIQGSEPMERCAYRAWTAAEKMGKGLGRSHYGVLCLFFKNLFT